MPHSSKEPPAIVRFLSVKTRLSIALKSEEWSAAFAEWIAPELKESRATDPTQLEEE